MALLEQQLILLHLPQPEWFNKSIAEAISNRQKAYNISKLRPSPETKVAHIKECRNVDKLIRRAKLNEEDRVAAAAKDNPKCYFQNKININILT